MPYVKRDKDGHISGLLSHSENNTLEELPADHPDVNAYLRDANIDNYTSHLLHQSDDEFIRVLEDLIDVLLNKNIILLTDLPLAAQQKLMKRKQIRQQHGHSILSDDNDDIF